MTVKQLIEKLKGFPSALEVLTCYDDNCIQELKPEHLRPGVKFLVIDAKYD